MPGSGVRVPPLLLSEPPGRPAALVFAAIDRAVHAGIRAKLVVLLSVLSVACQPAQAREPGLSAFTADSVLVAAAGDLVCGIQTPQEIPCLANYTAALVRQLQPNALLLLGDLQYETGSAQDFAANFHPTFGEFKSITWPVPGNHEYFTRGARGYFDYFNGAGVDSGRAGSRRRGYYSFELGAWHIVALNTNCPEIGGCGPRSPQVTWLKADLAAHPARCTLAFAHAAPFSSGVHGNDLAMRDLWKVLYEGGADVFLAGHDHQYERFAPQDAEGRADTVRGIRSFVVGTGGKGLSQILTPRPNSELQDNQTIGVLLLTLRPDDYTWRFAPVPGIPKPVDDSGRAACGA